MAASVVFADLPSSAAAVAAEALPETLATRAHVEAGACRLVALPGAERALTSLALSALVMVPRLESRLGVKARAPYTVTLIPPGPPDATAREISVGVPDWAAGWMNASRRVGAIRLAEARRYPFGTPEGVLAHESAHLLLGDAAAGRLPLWFEEGVATWAARDWQLQDAMMLSWQIIAREPPRLAELEPAFHGTAGSAEEAYASSFAFVSWAEHEYGEAFLRGVIARVASRPFAEAWREASGVTLDVSERQWRGESRFQYRWLPIIAASGSFWFVAMLLASIVWWRRRRRGIEIRKAWEAEAQWIPPLDGESDPDRELGSPERHERAEDDRVETRPDHDDPDHRGRST